MNIKRALLQTDVIESKLRLLFGKWRTRRSDRGVPFLMSDFEQALELQITKLCYLDESDVGPLYSELRTDSFGLAVYTCARGTNRVESWHSAIPDFVHAASGDGLANYLLHLGASKYNRRRRVECGSEIDRADTIEVLRKINELSLLSHGEKDYPDVPDMVADTGERFFVDFFHKHKEDVATAVLARRSRPVPRQTSVVPAQPVAPPPVAAPPVSSWPAPALAPQPLTAAADPPRPVVAPRPSPRRAALVAVPDAVPYAAPHNPLYGPPVWPPPPPAPSLLRHAPGGVDDGRFYAPRPPPRRVAQVAPAPFLMEPGATNYFPGSSFTVEYEGYNPMHLALHQAPPHLKKRRVRSYAGDSKPDCDCGAMDACKANAPQSRRCRPHHTATCARQLYLDEERRELRLDEQRPRFH